MDKYKLLVFDWDGTVADSLHHIVAAMESAIEAVQLPARTRDQILDIIGLGMHEAAATLFPDVDSELHQQMISRYGQTYLAATFGKTLLFPGAKETLEQLRESGYMLAVATGKSRRGLERALADTELKQLFHTTRCADETFSKPHPQMLMDIMQTLDMEPSQTVMIGDSLHDLQMAVNAKVASVAVSYGAQRLERLQELNPVTRLHHLTELPVWLNTQ
jgi:phosphoglycolate phosphatase